MRVLQFGQRTLTIMEEVSAQLDDASEKTFLLSLPKYNCPAEPSDDQITELSIYCKAA